MNRLVIDSWAWIEYFDGTSAGRKVHELLQEETNRAYSSAVSLAEVVSKFERRGGKTGEAAQAVATLSTIVPADDETAIDAGKTHAEMKRKTPDFGLADAFVIATAKKLDAKIITGDPHFKGVKNAILL